ncbi:hypothetical protein MSAN_02473200 [Mycena sanguinolenta]|uniref:Uncharacterized protein n=1 Tax=Mycena sanguinolenta TaxID=230812 RepID=A0A8H6U4E6_9AGAR|nr:hypothetical protein MSAN_02473200 [Mycena sanguinolenta]
MNPAFPLSPPPFRKRSVLPPTSPLPRAQRKTIDVSDAVLPKGNKLIVRGVYNKDEATHDPVRTLEKAVEKLAGDDPTLRSFPLVILPFSDNYPNKSVAYVSLHPSLASGIDDEPRCDLLDTWRERLQNANPNWEVTWAPANEGVDKRMWARFPTLVADLGRKLDKEPSKDDVVKCLEEILKANNIVYERAFALGTSGGKNPTGAAAILVHPRQLDSLLRKRSINPGGVLDGPVGIERTKQVEIHYPFELVVAGISTYEGLDTYIENYLLQFEDADGEQQLAGSRIPDGYRDLFVFHMTTWSATKRVLLDHKTFSKTFAKWQTTLPALLFDLNDGKVPWKANNPVVEGAEKVAGKIDDLTRRFAQVERDMGSRIDATHAVVSQIQKNTNILTDQVSQIAMVQQTTCLSVASLHKELAFTRQRAQLEAAESSLRVLTMLGGTDEEKDNARRNIEAIKAEKQKIDNQIDDLHGVTLALPPPPQRTLPSPATPTRPPHVQNRAPPSTDSPTVYHSPPESRSPTAAVANKKRRLSKENDDDITETSSNKPALEGEVDMETSDSDSPMDNAPPSAI